MASSRQYGAGLEALAHIKTVSPEQAYALFSMKAYCLVQLKSFLPAREMAEKAKQYAQTTEQQLQASAFLSHLDTVERQSSAPPPVADGLSKTRAMPQERAGDKPTILQRSGKHEAGAR